MSKHDWQYVRTNSKGERIFRKETNESLEFVREYLDKHGIEYEVVMSASLIIIYSKADRLQVDGRLESVTTLSIITAMVLQTLWNAI